MSSSKLIRVQDTDFVRDNMLINYCLNDDEKLLIESFVLNNGIDLRFDVSHFYFFLTGVHNQFVAHHTPDTFGLGVQRALNVYDTLLDCLHNHGYDGNVFLVKVDNSKQVGLLFSPKDSPLCTPGEMAELLFQSYKLQKNPYSAPQYNSTSFVGPYHGYEAIHDAFVEARQLNDLIFFGVKDRVITQEYKAQTAVTCNVMAITVNCRKLTTLFCNHSLPTILKHLDFIVHDMVMPSYSMTHFLVFYIFLADFFGMLESVYGSKAHVDYPDYHDFPTLKDYHDFLSATLTALYELLIDEPHYSPTILIALSYINQNYTSEISLSQLAEYAYTNASTLSSSFNREVGLSLSDYIAGKRIAYAETLLKTTEMTIPEIAESVGFVNANYFREIFKKHTGKSPLKVRKEPDTD